MRGATTTVETSAERRQHLSHVANEIVVDFGVIYHDQSSPVGLQRRSDVVRTKSGDAITMLDDDGRDSRVGQEPRNVRRLPLSPDPTSVTTRSIE